MALGIFTCRRSLQCIAPNKRCRARQREKRVNEINAKTKAWGEKAALLARSLAPSTDQPLNTQDSSRTRCALGVLKFEVLRDLLVGLPRVVVLNVGVGIGASPLYSCTTYSHILLPVRSTSCESAWLPMSRRTEYSRSPYFESHLWAGQGRGVPSPGATTYGEIVELQRLQSRERGLRWERGHKPPWPFSS